MLPAQESLVRPPLEPFTTTGDCLWRHDLYPAYSYFACETAYDHHTSNSTVTATARPGTLEFEFAPSSRLSADAALDCIRSKIAAASHSIRVQPWALPLVTRTSSNGFTVAPPPGLLTSLLEFSSIVVRVLSDNCRLVRIHRCLPANVLVVDILLKDEDAVSMLIDDRDAIIERMQTTCNAVARLNSVWKVMKPRSGTITGPSSPSSPTSHLSDTNPSPHCKSTRFDDVSHKPSIRPRVNSCLVERFSPQYPARPLPHHIYAGAVRFVVTFENKIPDEKSLGFPEWFSWNSIREPEPLLLPMYCSGFPRRDPSPQSGSSSARNESHRSLASQFGIPARSSPRLIPKPCKHSSKVDSSRRFASDPLPSPPPSSPEWSP